MGGHPSLTLADESSITKVKRLLALGAKINAQDPLLGETALMKATRKNRIEIIRYLVSKGGNPRIRNREGITALDIARKAGDESIFKLLSAAGRKRRPDLIR